MSTKEAERSAPAAVIYSMADRFEGFAFFDARLAAAVVAFSAARVPDQCPALHHERPIAYAAIDSQKNPTLSVRRPRTIRMAHLGSSVPTEPHRIPLAVSTTCSRFAFDVPGDALASRLRSDRGRPFGRLDRIVPPAGFPCVQGPACVTRSHRVFDPVVGA